MNLNGFDAELVTVGPLDDGVEHVGWASNRDPEGPHLILLRGVGNAEVCIVSDDDQTYGTHYGGIVSVRVQAMKTRTAEVVRRGCEPLYDPDQAVAHVNEAVF